MGDARLAHPHQRGQPAFVVDGPVRPEFRNKEKNVSNPEIESRIRIRLKAYDFRLLDKSVAEIIKNTRNTGAKIVGPIPLPTERTLYTILRSPHVNKKAQDQFQMLVHKRMIDIINPTPQTTTALKKLNLPAGVHVEIKV